MIKESFPNGLPPEEAGNGSRKLKEALKEMEARANFWKACEKLAKTSREAADLVRRSNELSDESQTMMRKYGAYLDYAIGEQLGVMIHNTLDKDSDDFIEAPHLVGPNKEQMEAREAEIDEETAKIDTRLMELLVEAGMWPPSESADEHA